MERRFWDSILSQFFQKSLDTAQTEGAGISVYKFMEKEKPPFNCLYYYSPSGDAMWEMLINQSGAKAQIADIYNPETMVMISIHIPTGTGSTLSQIRIFNHDKTEITF